MPASVHKTTVSDKGTKHFFQMRANIYLALLMAIAITLVSASDMRGNNRHRMKRAPQNGLFLLSKKVLPALALASQSGGDGASPLPPHIDPNIGMSTDKFHRMPIDASFSGPFATLGVMCILVSAFMAVNYFQAVNVQRRSSYAGPYIQKRSSFDVNPESIVSLINSFR